MLKRGCGFVEGRESKLQGPQTGPGGLQSPSHPAYATQTVWPSAPNYSPQRAHLRGGFRNRSSRSVLGLPSARIAILSNPETLLGGFQNGHPISELRLKPNGRLVLRSHRHVKSQRQQAKHWPKTPEAAYDSDHRRNSLRTRYEGSMDFSNLATSLDKRVGNYELHMGKYPELSDISFYMPMKNLLFFNLYQLIISRA